MKATIDLEKFPELKKSIDLMADLNDKEFTLSFDPEGMRVLIYDVSNICAVHLSVPKARFEHYESTGEEITILMTEFRKAIKRCLKGLIIFESEDAHLNIENGTRKFSVRMLEPIGEQKKIPKVAYHDEYLVVNSQEAKEAIEDALVAEETIRLKTVGNSLIIYAKGRMNGSGTLVYTGKHSPDEARYSEEYLMKILTTITPLAKLEFRKDQPLTVTYEKEDFILKIILAPRSSGGEDS